MNFFSANSLMALKTIEHHLGHCNFDIMGMGYIEGFKRKSYTKLEKIKDGEICERKNIYGVVWGNLSKEDIAIIAKYECKSGFKSTVEVQVFRDKEEGVINAVMLM